MLQLQNTTKTFGGLIAVKDITLSVEGGEIYSLVGPNGSGKTTIIKLVAGLLNPTIGTITIGGHDMQKEPSAAKSLIGYIPDNPTIWENVTGEEFLHLVGALFGIDPKERAKRIQELLPLFSLEGIEKNYFEQYSRGNKQKFSIIAALLHKPKLLLIDEPIVGLDPTSAEKAEHLFKNFAEEGGTILMATHTLPVAERTSTRIGVLREGSLLQSGTLTELQKAAGKDINANLIDLYKTLTAT